MKRIFFIIGWSVLLNIGYGQKIVDVFTINPSNKNLKEVGQDKSETITLQLTPNNIYAKDFKVIEKSEEGDKVVAFKAPLHFTGTVKEQSNSLVGFTVGEDQLMGVISYGGNNYNLEFQRQDKKEQHYILYRQEDYKHPLKFNCQKGEDKSSSIMEEYERSAPTSTARSSAAPIEIYLECDYNMYISFFRNRTRTANYATSLFNMVATVFRRSANVNITLSEVVVWTRQDPYRASPNISGYDVLNSFVSNNPSYNGQVAHLLTTSQVQDVRGVANTFGFCSGSRRNTGNLFSLSAGITNSFNSNLSIFSYDIFIMAHELGHNLGSPHTHDCAWNGNNTPIDCCGPSGCACSAGVPRTGTIMSYCNNKDLSQGFHPQVATRIRNFSECLSQDEGGGNDHALSLSVSGTGQINVTHNQNTRACTNSCTFSYPDRSTVTLTAQMVSGYRFVRWEGDGCFNSSNTSCTISMIRDASIRAVFQKESTPNRNLSLSVSGSGQINANSAQNNRTCSSNCTLSYPDRSAIKLTAQAAPNYRFVRWEGDVCNFGTNTSCSLTLVRNLSVRAIFEQFIIDPTPTLDFDIDIINSATCTTKGNVSILVKNSTPSYIVKVYNNRGHSKTKAFFMERNCLDGDRTKTAKTINPSATLAIKDLKASSILETFPSTPNPFRNQVSIPFSLAEKHTLTLEIFHSSGKRVYHLQQEFDTGRHQLELDHSIFKNSGMYIYKIQTETQIKTGKLIRL